MHLFAKKLANKYISTNFVSLYDISKRNITKTDSIMNENIVLTEAVFYTLLALHAPLHGYGIMQETEKMSNGRLKLSAGTLYGVLSTMLEKGWIKALPSEKESRRKDFQITEIGKVIAKNEMSRLEELVSYGKKIIEGKHALPEFFE